MAERAHVTSLEALESFKANLITYVSKARPTLEEVSSDLLRTRLWLQNDQRMHWEGQVRRRTNELQEALQTLSSARMSNLRVAQTTEQRAMLRAKRALEEAEGKLKMLKAWNRDFDSRVEPLARPLEKLHTILANDMNQAAAYLAQAIQTLAAYADLAPPGGPANVPATPDASGTQDGARTPLEEAEMLPPPAASPSATSGSKP